jgi:hypothetical protein
MFLGELVSRLVGLVTMSVAFVEIDLGVPW